MKRLIFGLVATIAISACSHDKKNNPAAPETPDRKSEHNQAECPADITGQFVEKNDASNVFEIVIQNGFLVIKDQESGDIVVNGQPTVDKGNGSSTTVICKNNTIELNAKSTDGTSYSATISKTADGIQSQFKDQSGSNTVYFVRAGAPNSPTETDLNLQVTEQPIVATGLPETRGRPDLTEILEPGEVVVDQVTCNTGYMKTYTLVENGCSTGEHTFCSKQDYCAGLKNDTLNKGCAKGIREAKFQAGCL